LYSLGGGGALWFKLDPNDSLIYNLNYADDTSLNDLPDDDLLDDMLINCNSEEGQNEKTIQCIECTDDIALAVVESTMSTLVIVF
jgi:hypothetical protein